MESASLNRFHDGYNVSTTGPPDIIKAAGSQNGCGFGTGRGKRLFSRILVLP
jgi:hypothetical protein